MENGDDWLAHDKLQHLLFCFSISIIFSFLASRTRYSFLRRHSIWVGSIVSLSAGAAKEIADEFGFFKSAGASAKDALADLLGVLIAVVYLYLYSCTPVYSKDCKSWGVCEGEEGVRECARKDHAKSLLKKWKRRMTIWWWSMS